MNISVFIPAYNEEKILEKNIKKVHSFLSKHFKTFELVVIDDSSKDATAQVGKKLAKLKNIRYLRYENGPSRRENLGKAMRTAKYDVISYMDLDLAVSLNQFLKLVAYLDDGYDIAVGSGNIPGASVHRSLYRLIWSRMYHRTLQFMFNSKVQDYQCGFKVFKKNVLFKLLDAIGYDTSFTRGWFWDAELLVTAEKKGYKIKEMPVQWVAGKQSSFNLRRELKVVPYIFKLKFRKF